MNGRACLHAARCTRARTCGPYVCVCVISARVTKTEVSHSRVCCRPRGMLLDTISHTSSLALSPKLPCAVCGRLYRDSEISWGADIASLRDLLGTHMPSSANVVCIGCATGDG